MSHIAEEMNNVPEPIVRKVNLDYQFTKEMSDTLLFAMGVKFPRKKKKAIKKRMNYYSNHTRVMSEQEAKDTFGINCCNPVIPTEEFLQKPEAFTVDDLHGVTKEQWDAAGEIIEEGDPKIIGEITMFGTGGEVNE